MSFIQNLHRIDARKLSLKQNKKRAQARQTMAWEEDLTMNSYIQAESQYCIDKEPSTKEESHFNLPSIRRDQDMKTEKSHSLRSNKTNRFFTEINMLDHEQQQQALFSVQQFQRPIRKFKKQINNKWQKRIKLQERNIILNYLNDKVEMKKPKKKKNKRHAMNQQKIVEFDEFVLLPSNNAKKYKRQSTDFKRNNFQSERQTQHLKRRKSLDFLKGPKDLLLKKKQTVNFHKQTKLLDQLKKRIIQLQKGSKNFDLQKTKQHSRHISRPSDTKLQNLTTISKINNREIQEQKTSEFIVHTRRKLSLNSIRTDKTSEIDGKFKLKDRTNSSKKLMYVSVGQNQSRNGNTICKKNRQVHEPLEESYQPDYDTFQAKQQQNSIERKQSERNSTSSEGQNKNQKLSMNKSAKLLLQRQKNKHDQKTIVHFDKQAQMPAVNQEKIEEMTPGSKQLDECQIKSQSQGQYFRNQHKNLISRGENVYQNKLSKSPRRIPDKTFLRIKTYYASAVQDPLKLVERLTSPIKTSHISIVPKRLPSKQELSEFIQSYIPQNTQIHIQSFIALDNFKIILDENKQLYFGQIVNNNKSDLGVTIKHNYLYEGRYANGQKVEGVEINETGKYVGTFGQNGKREGRGEFLWPNGQFYNGEWKNGKKHGDGMWTSPNGDSYVGQWVNGKVQGQGIHSSANGQRYQGSFLEFLKEGWGKEILPNGDTYQGQFFRGKPHGRGKYAWKSKQIYEGQFIEGFRQGIGVLKDSNGNIYKGNFVKEEASGQCQIHFYTQDYYEGQIENGIFNGISALQLYQQEQIWEGKWNNDSFVPQDEENQ